MKLHNETSNGNATFARSDCGTPFLETVLRLIELPNDNKLLSMALCLPEGRANLL